MTSELDLGISPRAWWRCPAAVTAFHVQRTLLGLAVGWPLARWLGGRMVGRPGGDATLFDDGGVLLAEAIRSIAPAVRALASTAIVTALVAVAVGHVALAGLLDALARPAALGLRARLAAATSPLPHLALVSLAGLVLGGGLFGIAWWTGKSIVRDVASSPAGRDLGAVVVALVGVSLASTVGVFQDLVAACLVARRLDFMAALDLSWQTVRRRPFGLWFQRGVRSAGAAVAVLAAALAAIRVGMRAESDAALAQAILEGALVAATCLRASWLSVACAALHDRATWEGPVASALQEAEDSSKNPPAATPR